MDKTPQVVKVVYDFRQQVDAHEIDMINEMSRQWLQVESRLEDDIDLLAKEIQRRMATGEEITQQMLWKMDAYKKTQSEVVRQLKIYNNKVAVPTISKYQTLNAVLGIDVANNALATTFLQVAAGSPYWQKLNLDAMKGMIGLAGNGSPLQKLLEKSYGDATAGLMDAMVNSITRGFGVTTMAKEMRDAVNMGLERSLLIARTESARMYRTASTLQYRTSGVVDGFYRIVKKSTACLACLVRDGEWYETEDELEDHPRGKCGTIPAVHGMPKPAWENGKDWFMNQPDEYQQKLMGKEMWGLWKQENFPLEDLTKIKPNDIWGGSPTRVTLDDMYKKLGIQRPQTGGGYTPPQPPSPIPPVANPPITPPTPQPPMMNQKMPNYPGIDEAHRMQMDDLIDYANNSGIKLDISNLNQEHLEGFLNALKGTANVNPNILNRVRVITSELKNEFNGRTIAYWQDGYNLLAFNPKHAVDPFGFRNTVAFNQGMKWFYLSPPGMETQYIISHELGHVTHHWIETEIWKRPNQEGYTAFHEVMRKMFKQSDISGYSHDKRTECFAEAFAQMTTTNASEWSEATKILNKYLKDEGWTK